MKKIGAGVKKVLGIAVTQQGRAAITAFLPGGVANVFNHVVQLVITAEQMGAALGTKLSGSDKAAMVMTFVPDMIRNSELLVGKQIVDEGRFMKGCRLIIDGVHEILHAIDDPEPQAGEASPPQAERAVRPLNRLGS